MASYVNGVNPYPPGHKKNPIDKPVLRRVRTTKEDSARLEGDPRSVWGLDEEDKRAEEMDLVSVDDCGPRNREEDYKEKSDEDNQEKEGEGIGQVMVQ